MGRARCRSPPLAACGRSLLHRQQLCMHAGATVKHHTCSACSVRSAARASASCTQGRLAARTAPCCQAGYGPRPPAWGPCASRPAAAARSPLLANACSGARARPRQAIGGSSRPQVHTKKSSMVDATAGHTRHLVEGGGGRRVQRAAPGAAGTTRQRHWTAAAATAPSMQMW